MEKKLPETLAQLIADWPQPAPVKLMFQDEARFGRINDVRRCWAPRPVRPLCRAMVTHEYTYAYGAVDVLNGELDSLILPHVNTDCMQIFLDEVGARHPMHRIIMVLDGAGWHASAELKPPGNMKLLSLPPYAPELNPVEHLWDELREKHFHNKAFDSLDALEDQLQTGLLALGFGERHASGQVHRFLVPCCINLKAFGHEEPICAPETRVNLKRLAQRPLLQALFI